MNGQDFLRIVKATFVPFLKEMDFVMNDPSISGRFYRVSFTGPSNVVSVSYEPSDDTLFIMVLSRENGQLSDIDDRLKTPRLADLNSRYMQKIGSDERASNEVFFESVVVRDNSERLLLKAAKELRLVLPKYLQS